MAQEYTVRAPDSQFCTQDVRTLWATTVMLNRHKEKGTMAQYRKVRLLFTRSEMGLIRLDVDHNKRRNSLTFVQKDGDRQGWIVQDDDMGFRIQIPLFELPLLVLIFFFFFKPPKYYFGVG